MYGILPFDSQLMLGDMTQKNQFKKLAGLSFQEHAIINVKFIADTTEGLIFAALIAHNNQVNYPPFHGRIDTIHIDGRQRRFSTNPMKQTIIPNPTPITPHKPTRKTNRGQGECQCLSNAEKKRYRKEKNLTLSKKNWKQFLRKRKSVIDQINKNKEIH